MQFENIVFWSYIVLLLIGGLIGFFSARSKVSLMTSAVAAALLILTRLPGVFQPGFGRGLSNVFMPKRTDIHSVLIIGAGPIIIGQACEFDYSGTQACKALKEEGYRVVLINSNPATIMTDPEFADRTYIEPITPACVEKIIV